MKVICINDKPRGRCESPWLIEEGEVYEVISILDTVWGDYYELSIQPGSAYDNTFFAPWDGDEAIQELIAQPKEEACYA